MAAPPLEIVAGPATVIAPSPVPALAPCQAWESSADKRMTPLLVLMEASTLMCLPARAVRPTPNVEMLTAVLKLIFS